MMPTTEPVTALKLHQQLLYTGLERSRESFYRCLISVLVGW